MDVKYIGYIGAYNFSHDLGYHLITGVEILLSKLRVLVFIYSNDENYRLNEHNKYSKYKRSICSEMTYRIL